MAKKKEEERKKKHVLKFQISKGSLRCPCGGNDGIVKREQITFTVRLAQDRNPNLITKMRTKTSTVRHVRTGELRSRDFRRSRACDGVIPTKLAFMDRVQALKRKMNCMRALLNARTLVETMKGTKCIEVAGVARDLWAAIAPRAPAQSRY